MPNNNFLIILDDYPPPHAKPLYLTDFDPTRPNTWSTDTFFTAALSRATRFSQEEAEKVVGLLQSTSGFNKFTQVKVIPDPI